MAAHYPDLVVGLGDVVYDTGARSRLARHSDGSIAAVDRDRQGMIAKASINLNVAPRRPGCSCTYGNMRHTFFVSEADRSEEIDIGVRKYVRGERGEAETCDAFCSAMGRGHIHILPCNPASCDIQGQVTLLEGQRRHAHTQYSSGHIGQPVPDLDELTHDCYWSSINFADPCSVVQQAEFRLCGAVCGSHAHDKDELEEAFACLWSLIDLVIWCHGKTIAVEEATDNNCVAFECARRAAEERCRELEAQLVEASLGAKDSQAVLQLSDALLDERLLGHWHLEGWVEKMCGICGQLIEGSLFKSCLISSCLFTGYLFQMLLPKKPLPASGPYWIWRAAEERCRELEAQLVEARGAKDSQQLECCNPGAAEQMHEVAGRGNVHQQRRRHEALSATTG
eukprot:gene2623-2924_t